MPDGLRMYTIYHRPRDYPGQFVLRGGTATPAGYEHDPEPLAVVATIDEARAAIPIGLTYMPRSENDDPVILEVWF